MYNKGSDISDWWLQSMDFIGSQMNEFSSIKRRIAESPPGIRIVSSAQFRWRRKPAKRNFARGESLRHQARNSDGLGHTHYLASPQIWALSGRQAEACPVMGVTSGNNAPSPWGCRYCLGRVCEETGFEEATYASMATSIVVAEISLTKRDSP